MSRSRRRRFFEKHLGTMVAIGLLILGAIAYVAFENMERAAAARQLEIAREQHWPPVRAKLQNALADFDHLAAAAPVQLHDIAPLDEALAAFHQLQRQFPRARFPDADVLITHLQDRRQTHLSELLWGKSIAAEQLARELRTQANGDPTLLERALEQMRTALEAQDRIHQEFPDHARSRYPRSAELRSWIHAVEAEPLQRDFEAQMREAAHHQDNQDWELAKQCLAEAKAVQQAINERFPNAPQADFTAILRIDQAIRELDAEVLRQQSHRELEKADIAEEAGNESLAIEHLTQALAIQNQIHRDFPHTSAHSRQGSEAIATRIQILRAREPLAQLQRMNEALDLLLSEAMHTHVGSKLQQIREHYRLLVEQNPLHPDLPTHLLAKVTYLDQALERLPSIRAQFATLAGPDADAIAPQSKTAVLSPLVPQRLFEDVMGVNPSRNLGETFPVDSVSYEDVLRFCERLSIITTLQISPAEMDAVRQAEPTQSDSVQSTNIQFEWVQPSADTPVGHAGVRDMQTGSATAREAHHRSRTVGFRFQIEPPSSVH